MWNWKPVNKQLADVLFSPLSAPELLFFHISSVEDKKTENWIGGRKGEKQFLHFKSAMNFWRQASQIQTGGCKHKYSQSMSKVMIKLSQYMRIIRNCQMWISERGHRDSMV